METWIIVTIVVVVLVIVVVLVAGFLIIEHIAGGHHGPPSNKGTPYPETQFDSTIPTPTVAPQLVEMGKLPGSPYWCETTYYAAKFVDDNGHYGNLGPWSCGVVSEPSSTCTLNKTQGDTCGFGAVTMGFAAPDRKYRINLYRKVGKNGIPEALNRFIPGTNSHCSSCNYLGMDQWNPHEDNAPCKDCPQ